MLILVVVMGVLVGWLSQLSDTMQRMIVMQVHTALNDPDAQKKEKALQEGQATLESNLVLTNATMYLGLAIVVVAGFGSWSARRDKVNEDSH